MNKKRTMLVYLLLAGFGLSSCDDMTVTTGDGSEKVVGNGVLRTEDRDVGPFGRIKLEGVFNVFLSQGDKESLKIEAEENVLPLIATTVENNVLTVSMKENTSISKMKKINIHITLKDITEISSKGVGMLNTATSLKLRELMLSCQGVGATRLEIEAEKLTIRSEIVGALFLKGKVKEASIEHKGVGAVEAFELVTEKMNLVSEGVGTAEVNASQELSVRAAGLGGVKYKGNPAVTNFKQEGLGKIVAVN